MLVRDVMTHKVVTIPSNTPLPEAKRLLEFHKFERLPVVDMDKLVGLVTKDDILKVSPSPATSLSRSEILYILSKQTVRQIMKENLVTVTPRTTIEQAIVTAQEKRVGCLPVVEEERVVGILTAYDIFYKIINPLFGIGETGKCIIVHRVGELEQMKKVFECINKAGLKIKTFWQPPGAGEKDLILHLETKDIAQLVSQLKEVGFSIDERELTI